MTVAVLLTVVFLPISNQQSNTYDPWIDYNENGTIDVDDLASMGRAYGSSGDPTRNVTIAGHATRLLKWENISVSPTGGNFTTGLVAIDGYAKVSALVHMDTAVNELRVGFADNTDLFFYTDKVINFDYDWTKTYDVMNRNIKIYVFNHQGTQYAHVWIPVYLVA